MGAPLCFHSLVVSCPWCVIGIFEPLSPQPRLMIWIYFTEHATHASSLSTDKDRKVILAPSLRVFSHWQVVSRISSACRRTPILYSSGAHDACFLSSRFSRNIVSFVSFLRCSSMLTHNDRIMSLSIQFHCFAFLDRYLSCSELSLPTPHYVYLLFIYSNRFFPCFL